jgi:beta-glucosidase
MSVVDSPEHRQLAYEAAVKSVVLLKNKNNILPIAPNTSSIMVAGPNAAAVNVCWAITMASTAHGHRAGRHHRCAAEGMGMEYHQGMMLTDPGTTPNNWSISMAAGAGLTIACMGISPMMEGEEGEACWWKHGGDRTDRNAQAQIEYLRKLNIAGARIVLVLFGGSPVALGEAEEWSKPSSMSGIPAQEGGRAVADVLFGKASPPASCPSPSPSPPASCRRSKITA